MSSRRLVASVLPVVLAAALSPSCSEPAPTVTPRAPVLVIGLDGLEWSVMRPLLAAGEMPHTLALMERGTWGWLETFVPTSSPVVWTTIATGKSMDQHRIKGFSDKQGRVYSSARRAGKALWNIADDHGLTTNVLGWWVTWPVEPIGGLMVSATTAKSMENQNWKPALMPGFERQVHPESLTDRVMAVAERAGSRENIEAIARTRIFGDLSGYDVKNPEARLINQTTWSIQSDATYFELAKDLLPDHPADLTMVYLGGTDVIGHRFWRQYSPDEFQWSGQDAALDEALANAIPNYYRWADEMIGELVALAGEGTDVFIVSDHGMHAVSVDAPTQSYITGHHPNGAPGVIIAAGPDIRQQGGVQRFLDKGSLARVATVFDVAPNVLALLGIPASREMKGNVHEILFNEEARAAVLSLARIPSHDVGFREPAVLELPDEMSDAFEKRMMDDLVGLGYVGGDLEGDGAPVSVEGFVPERTAPADADPGG